MNSQELQEKVYTWALSGSFSAPYGVLKGEHKDRNGRKYRSVTFGYARSRDVEVRIYSHTFVLVRDSRDGNQVFKTVDSLMGRLAEI